MGQTVDSVYSKNNFVFCTKNWVILKWWCSTFYPNIQHDFYRRRRQYVCGCEVLPLAVTTCVLHVFISYLPWFLPKIAKQCHSSKTQCTLVYACVETWLFNELSKALYWFANSQGNKKTCVLHCSSLCFSALSIKA